MRITELAQDRPCHLGGADGRHTGQPAAGGGAAGVVGQHQGQVHLAEARLGRGSSRTDADLTLAATDHQGSHRGRAAIAEGQAAAWLAFQVEVAFRLQHPGQVHRHRPAHPGHPGCHIQIETPKAGADRPLHVTAPAVLLDLQPVGGQAQVTAGLHAHCAFELEHMAAAARAAALEHDGAAAAAERGIDPAQIERAGHAAAADRDGGERVGQLTTAAGTDRQVTLHGAQARDAQLGFVND